MWRVRNPHHTNFALVATLASWASNLLLSLPDLESQQRLISRIFARLRAPWHLLCRMCRSPRHAQRGSLLDTHTYQQVRAPLSLPSRASCASSAIATANSSSHRATSEDDFPLLLHLFLRHRRAASSAARAFKRTRCFRRRTRQCFCRAAAASFPMLLLQPQSGRARARSLAARLASRDGELSLFSTCCRSGGCSHHAAPAPPPRARAA